MTPGDTRIIDLTVDELREIIQAEFKLASTSIASPVIACRKVNLQKLCSTFGFAKPTVYEWVAKRCIPHSKVGRRLFFDLDEIEKFIEERRIRTRREIEDNES